MLKQRPVLFLDFAKGGWRQIYEITDNGKVIGGKSVGRHTRKAPEIAEYRLVGDERVFTSAQAFAEAYYSRNRTKDD
jgi:hypothetical protein